MRATAFLALGLASAHALPAALDAPLACTHCAEWNVPQAPFKLLGTTYYVGTRGLSSVLIAGREGHVLIDGALPQSAPLIRRNIESLGYRVQDVKLIVNSHAHVDHAGGIAALQAWSGARVAASPPSAAVLQAGTVGHDDPQYEEPPMRVPPVRNVRPLADGETLRIGDIALTAHFTPGHTAGGTTWSWRACEGATCATIVYADSLTPVSLGEYRFTPGAPAFRRSIDEVANLPCDIAVSAHPEFTQLLEKQQRAASGTNPFIDPAGCRAYAATARKALEARLAKEGAAAR